MHRVLNGYLNFIEAKCTKSNKINQDRNLIAGQFDMSWIFYCYLEPVTSGLSDIGYGTSVD